MNSPISAWNRAVCFVWLVALCGGMIPRPAWAGGVVTGNTDAELRAALAGGGTVTFAFDGTIPLTNTLTIASDTVIDGTGHNVAISGGGAVRILWVNNGANLTLKHVAVLNGYDSGDSGAGLYNLGTAIIADCTFSNNVVANGPVFGGAILHAGSRLQVTGSTFVNNGAAAGGRSVVAFPLEECLGI